MSTATVNGAITEQPDGSEKEKPLGGRFVGFAANYIDERTSLSGLVKELGRKIFPDHWSFMLGEIALWSFVVVLISGTFLTFFFQASMVPTHYAGAYIPMRGIEMSAALDSSLRISFDIRGGLLVRQIHHWAALTFVAGIGVHMLRVFFTGAFRKPREINWVIGFVLFVLAMAEGFTGYSLPDDLLSGNGLRIIDGMVKGIPLIGTWISYLLFGGEFPGDQIVGRLYTLHILLLPAILVALLALHLVLMIINKHTQFAGPARTNSNVVGYPMLPVYVSKMGGFFFITFGVIVLIASLFTINPIWNYGPYDPSPVSAGTQPDWYIGFADGALRLVPPHLESVFWGHTWSWNIILPLAVLVVFIVIVALYPFLEAWITGDKREHHIAQRPRNAATRTAIGAAGVTFYAALWAAASSDIIATHFWVTMEGVIHVLQATLILGPVLAYFVTKRICIALQKKDREIALHGYESGRIVRLPGGEYIEVHQPVDEYERWKLVDFETYAPLVVRPNDKGNIPWHQNVRASLSRWFFEDRLSPVTQAELDEAVAHQHHTLDDIAHEEAEEIDGARQRAIEDGKPVVESGVRAEVELPLPSFLDDKEDDKKDATDGDDPRS
ncbi:ubiquinol-cytochrome c reductase cytochrome b subunit [Microbacterium halimionae]|uniref:Cytochrome bc1 complex cytochrome b subunit n=1 Tax=Microbacterium halimionae TaxID=1526413 RepID=A0A7W3JNU3_9MICO|nr:cytochrome bc complex cytochrome b subunit [Microbacterium halimionae]MBA8816276.1 ubiquinol-cytochrome c reductase cytochrome b subunit [Microbacterium halimionae]NII96479.1 ubiquinol-cytochrome c reductase cytochrome b subunit [Microbacterium halimionae]